MAEKIRKSDLEWKKLLTSEQYRVTREKGTEPAFSGEYWNTKTEGVYTCACCRTPLFSSVAKFDSGSGWPSFSAPLDPGSVREESDESFFMTRTEVMCDACDAHLGHLFPDGPPPAGLRYCLNSAALSLRPLAGEGPAE